MKLLLEINDRVKNKISRKLLNKAAEETLKLGGGFLARKNIFDISVSLANVGEEEIKKLNRIYRHKNAATDVLSFAEHKNQKALAAAGSAGWRKKLFLGELILCYNNIKQYSQKNNINSSEELVRVVSHGLLHLLGFRHGKKMFEIQEEVAKMI